ncbi:transposase [Paenibacillus sp. FSL K6-2524]
MEKEIKMNLAYRWFLGFVLTARVPEHDV